MQDTARWDGVQPCALARGSDRGAPTLPSSAHEEGRPRVLVELTAPDVNEKNRETNPITSAGILANLAWREAASVAPAGPPKRLCRPHGRAYGRLTRHSGTNVTGHLMKLGFIGTGALTAAIVTGLKRAADNSVPVLLSPRNQAIAGGLASR